MNVLSDPPSSGVPIRLGNVSAIASALLEKEAAEAGAGPSFPQEQPPQDLPVPKQPIGSAPVVFASERTFVLERPKGPSRPPSRRSLIGLVNGLMVVALIVAGLWLKGDQAFLAFWHRQKSATPDKVAASLQPADGALMPPVEKIPRLIGGTSRAIRGQPAPLGLGLQGHVDGGTVLVAGLVAGMTLSVGTSVNASAWQLPASDAALGNTWVIPPAEFMGEVDLSSELRLLDGTIMDRAPIHLEWRLGPAGTAAAAPVQKPQPLAVTPVERDPPPIRQVDREDIAVMVEGGKRLMANGDLAAARLLLQRAAEASNAEAALLLGATYDPAILREFKGYGLAPDIRAARTWYQKAKELGSEEARLRLEALATSTR